ncbi:quinone oxidoreductase, partial [Xylella fastidiosa subsp. multiplex]|nr:quinone oxidoreductase [Xylella fastidiosa subsp. multiplex]
ADAVFGAILEGSLRIDIEGRYAMDDVQQVHARIEAREQIGKSVMRIGETG